MNQLRQLSNGRVRRLLDIISRRRVASVFLMGILSFGGSFCLGMRHGIPVPYIYDEFSYLLAADTFAHGRLTNPTHPLWEHFETFHELMKPTYMSKYPPGQAAFMALGQVVFGHPIYGVWLSTAFMCMAICWMLYAWVPPRWAFLGGLVGVLQFGVFSYWGQSYWGGAVAALGGALVFGALPRIFQHLRVRDALILGIGVVLVINTRPLEGILIGIPIGLMMPWRIQWDQLYKFKWMRSAVLPCCAVVALGIFVTGTYNQAVTGNPRLSPHILYSNTYSSVPKLIWQPLGPPRQYNQMSMELYEKQWTRWYYFHKRTWNGFWEDMKQDSRRTVMFYFGYPLAWVPMLFLLLRLRKPLAWRISVGAAIYALYVASMYCRAHPHYFAPFACLAVLLIIAGLRAMAQVKLGSVRAGLMAVIVLVAVQMGLNTQGKIPELNMQSYARIVEGAPINLPAKFTREQLKEALTALGGEHLVIVKYRQRFEGFREWVFNGADIDRSPVVWARDLGVDRNARLTAYFKDRHVWAVEVFERAKDYNRSDER